MKLHIPLFLLLILLTTSVLFGQMTSYYDRSNVFSFNQSASPYAEEIFSKIKEVLGVKKGDIEIYANQYIANSVSTAMPVIKGTDGHGNTIMDYQNVVLYNPAFMTQIEITTGSRWAGISIIAHEIGHHISGHIMSQYPFEEGESRWERELEADYYSGKALALMGAQPEDLQKAQRQMFTQWGKPTHPNTVQRIRSINKGWLDGGGKGNVETDLLKIWDEINKELTKWYR
jgi:hypothetical protein